MAALRTMPLLLLGLAPMAQAEVLDASASGFTLSNSRVVPVEPARAWEAMVGGIDRWWPRDHTWWGKDSKLEIRAQPGGCFCETADGRFAQHMQVVFSDPPRSLRLLGGLGPLQGMGLHGALEMRLAPEGDGTRITWWYRAGGYTPDDIGRFAPTVDHVQRLQLGGLATLLGASGVPGPDNAAQGDPQ